MKTGKIRKDASLDHCPWKYRYNTLLFLVITSDYN